MPYTPPWLYNEFKHVGVDYDDAALAEQYDEVHSRFRGDMAAASDRLLDALAVRETDTLVDIGCGTGTFAIRASRRCAAVYAVDVSEPMLAVARRKAEAAGCTNLTFANAGFLTYEHAGPPADIVTSTAALHHLPDFWKLVALRRIAAMLRPGGRLYLFDTVYSFDVADFAQYIQEKSAWFASQAGESFGDEAMTAFREENSTCDWIMEGLLVRAGFVIDSADYSDGMLAGYRAHKPVSATT